MIEDASLPLPEPSEPWDPPEALDGPSDLLAVASPAAARPFLLASDSARAVGVETTGVDEIRTVGTHAGRSDGSGAGAADPPGRVAPADAPHDPGGETGGPLLLARPILRAGPAPADPATPAASEAADHRPAPAANVVASPYAIRRETVVPGGSVVETVLLPERIGGAVIEWRVRGTPAYPIPEAGGPAELHLSFEVRRPTAFRAAGEHLILRSPDDGAVRLVRVVPAPSTWRVEESVDGDGGRARVLATLRTTPDETRVTLLAVLADDAADAAGALARAARVRVHERRADEALRSARRELLALRTGVTGMDDGLEWAKARMTALGVRAPDTDAGAVHGTPGGDGVTGAALEVLGLASIGAHMRATERLEAMAPSGRTLSPEGWIAHAAYASWSGRPHPRAADPERLLAAARSLRTGAPRGTVRRAALRAVADLLDALGRRDDAERVREGIGRTLRLPTAGVGGEGAPEGPAAADDDASARGPDPLATLEISGHGRAGGRGSPSTHRILRAWTLYADDASDGAYPLLRSHLAEAAHGSPEGWLDDPLAFFLTPVVLLHGLFGAQPDAPVGRLRLAPSLPASWTSMELRNIRLGDVTLDVGYTREGGPSTFVLRPTGGAVPATVVFEPRTPEPVARVLVDGEPAEVEIRPVGRRTAVRLQLPIDRERRVTLVGTDD